MKIRMLNHLVQTSALVLAIGVARGSGTLVAQDSTTAAAPAQDSTAMPQDTTFVVDRVVAVVGNRPVLASQVDEEIFSRQSQGVKLPDDPQGIRSVRQQIVSSIVDEELLV
jgi:hypothetical protein